MRKYRLKFLTALVIAGLIGCGDSQQNSHENKNNDTTSNETVQQHIKPLKMRHLEIGSSIALGLVQVLQLLS